MRLLALLAGIFGILAMIDSPACAQGGRDHMEFVRGLRSNGFPDLALEYLDNLKKNNPPPQIAVLFPLEYARTWLELAAMEPEESKRSPLVAQAKRDLDVFISANPKHPQTIQANVELARLTSLQAKIALNRAHRMDEGPLKTAEVLKARAELKNAATKFTATVTLLEAQIKQLDASKTPVDETVRQELKQFRMRALIDQGMNLVDIAESYRGEDSDDKIAKGEQLKAAKKVFEKVMYLDDKEPLCWVARAWSAESDYKSGDEEVAYRAFQELMAKRATTPAAAAGIRVARYFGITHPIEKDKLDLRGRIAKAEKDAGDWLRDYPSFRNSAEGLGARYYFAFAKRELGMLGVTRDRENKIVGLTPAAKAHFEEAQRLFKELVDVETEYTEKASRFRSQMLVTIADAEGHGDAPSPESLGNFERCYLMAQVQLARYHQFWQARMNPPKAPEPVKTQPEPKEGKKDSKLEAKKEPPKPKTPAKGPSPAATVSTDPKVIEKEIKAEEKRRYTNAINYLEHGLRITNSRFDSARDVFAAQLLLVNCYYQMRLFPQAAVLAEYTAISNPKMPKAPAAAIVAVESYNRAKLSASKIRDAALKEESEAERKKLEGLGEEERQKAEKTKEAERRKLTALSEDALKSDSERLRRAAQYVVDKFPTENSSDEARHFLALHMYKNEKKVREAWKLYAEIKPNYPDIQGVRLEMAKAALALAVPAEEKEPKEFNKALSKNIHDLGGLWTTTVALLEATPQPIDDCTVSDAVNYLDNRSQLIRMYFFEKKYDKSKLVADAMVKQVGKFNNLESEIKANATVMSKNFQMSSIRGQAFLEFEANNHAKVAELLNPVVAEIDKSLPEQAKEELTRPVQQLRETQRQILILALRSAVQSQKIDRAGEIMDVFDKTNDKAGAGDGNLGILQSLVNNVRDQIDDLESQGKKEEATALKKGFSLLLDRVAFKGDKLTVKMRIFIAKGYQLVDSFEKCSTLLESLRKIPAPPKPEPIAKDAPEAVRNKFNEANAPYKDWETTQHTTLFLEARSWRLSAKSKDNDKDRVEDLNKALKILTEVIGTPPPKGGPIPKDKQGWGFASVEIRKEKAMTLEEIARATNDKTKNAKLWGAAVQEWVGITNTFVPKLPTYPERLSPEDLRKFRTEEERVKRRAELEAQLTPEQRARRGTENQAIANKRNLYFELWFESKRCSVRAYEILGPAATKDDKDVFIEKFGKFAHDFHEFRTKNQDLPSTIKESIDRLIKESKIEDKKFEIPHLLKREYDKVKAEVAK